jgi:hypothetical protein
MPTANSERIEALTQEISGLRNDIKELRMLLLYQLLKTEEERSRGTFNDTIFVLAKQAIKRVADQLAELDRKPDKANRDERRSTKMPVKPDRTAQKPTVDVNKEIAILKNEMAKSLRDAAEDIEEGESKEDDDNEQPR